MTHDVPAMVMQVVAAVVQDNGSDAVVTLQSRFGPDLEMDDLDIGEVIMKLEEITGTQLPDGEIGERSTISDLIALVEDRIHRSGERDAWESVREAYRAIRARIAAGGPGWEPK